MSDYEIIETFPDLLCVGIQHRQPEEKAVAELLTDEAVRLEREPTNAYDSNAIKVYYEQTHIGYVKGEQAAWVAPVMDQYPDAQQDCYLTGQQPFGKGRGFHLGIYAVFFRPREAPAVEMMDQELGA